MNSEVVPLKSKMEFMWQAEMGGKRSEVQPCVGRAGTKGKGGRNGDHQLLFSEKSKLATTSRTLSLLKNHSVEGSQTGRRLHRMSFSFLADKGLWPGMPMWKQESEINLRIDLSHAQAWAIDMIHLRDMPSILVLLLPGRQRLHGCRSPTGSLEAREKQVLQILHYFHHDCEPAQV